MQQTAAVRRGVFVLLDRRWGGSAADAILLVRAGGFLSLLLLVCHGRVVQSAEVQDWVCACWVAVMRGVQG